MKKRQISFVIALTLTTSILGQGVLAEPFENQVSNEKIISLTEEIQQLDNQIIMKIIEIEELNIKIEETKNEVEKAELGIKETQEKLEKQTELLDGRLRGLYKEGTSTVVGFLNELITAESIKDFFSTISKINYITKADKRIIEVNNELKVQLEEEELYLRNLQKELENDIIYMEYSLKEIEETKEEVQILLADAILEEEIRIAEEQRRLEEERIAEELRRLEEERIAEEQRLNEQLNNNASEENELNNNVSTLPPVIETPSVNSPAPVPGDTSTNLSLADSIIEEAKKYLGVPYVWGGTSPDGFDCSGLVQYVYGKFGVSVPRVSQDQQNAGRQVALTDIQPGDLIFWGYPAWHVGIYIGNNQYIHAPQTGDVVRIAYLNINRLSSACRVL